MLRKCTMCGKGPQTGRKVVRKGMLKKKGGTGSKIVRSCKRQFLPNLQKIRIIIDKSPRSVYICAKCIKRGAFKKA